MQSRLVSRRRFLGAAGTSALGAAVPPPSALTPFGVVPSARQLLWHRLETYAFLHFTTNTFTDKEWGYGDESPELFNPSAFDADAIIASLKAGGMTAVILTCKHHDGFCLWPTRTTRHSVRSSSWRQGEGDVVRDISRAAARQGLKFGVYLSPWDRNAAAYGGPDYVAMYREQLRELLTGYGPICEVWHDGANGGDGFYGGARERRRIDKRTYYDWPRTWDLVRAWQPDAVIFSDVGPDIRWVGNERGIAAETSWATYDPVGADGGEASPGNVREKESPAGTRNGKRWLPAECDVSIRPGWFWHEKENGQVKSPKRLMDLYFQSVGRGASFLLNVPPDRRGLLHENDTASLAGFGKALRETFAANLAAGARWKTRSGMQGREYGPERLADGNRETFWMPADGVAQPEVECRFRRPAAFNVVRLREHLPLGQRVEAVALDEWNQASGAWREFATATSVGSCRLIRLASPVTTPRVRLRVTSSPAPPALTELGFYHGTEL